MKKRFISITIILSLLMTLSIGCTSGDSEDNIAEEQKKEESYIPVEVSEVKYKTLANITTMSGKISADKYVVIVPTIPGKVQTINVKDEDKVNKGDVLFTLDKNDIQRQVDQAKAGYDMAKINYDITLNQANIAKDSLERTRTLTESVLNNARENLENTKRLYEAGAVSKSQLEQVEIALEQQETQMQAQLDQAEMSASSKITDLANSQLEQAKLAYTQAKDALDNTIITSPLSGVVTSINIEIGSMASNAQASMNVVDMDRVYVGMEVVEGLINKLTPGQKVDLTIPAISSEPISAVLDNINPIPDTRTQLYGIKIYIENKDNIIKPGMFANVEIPLEVKDNVLSIPSQAVIVKGEKNIVYIVEDDKAIEKEIKVGLDTGSEVEIIEGLEDKDMVITKGFDYVENGKTIKVLEDTQQ